MIQQATDMISGIKKILLEKRTKVTFISGILFGIAAHGTAIFNKLSYHDDAAALFGLGLTLKSGRWMLDLLGRIQLYTLFGGISLYSTNTFNALVSILFIAAAACIAVEFFDIKNLLLCSVLSAYMVCFPVVTGLFAFMFTAPDYMLGLLMMTAGVYLVCTRKTIPSFIAGITLQACAIGVYQAWIPLGLGLYVCWFFKEIYDKENSDEKAKDIWKWFFGKSLKYVLAVILSLALYYVILHILLFVMHETLVKTAGLNEMGVMSIGAFFDRLRKAYFAFVFPEKTIANSLYTFNLKHFYKLMVLIMLVMIAILLSTLIKKDRIKTIQLLIPLLVLPLAGNFIFIMTEFEYIHSNLYYGQVTIFIFAVLTVQMAMDLNKKSLKLCETAAAVFFLLFCISLAKFDNVCYMKTTFAQSQAISYYTTLVTRIQSTEGYTDSAYVSFIHPGADFNDSIYIFPEFEPVTLLSYGNVKEYISDYSWQTFMRNWTGFNAAFKDPGEFESMPEVQEMPSYPDSGSIKLIGDTIVVKF